MVGATHSRDQLSKDYRPLMSSSAVKSAATGLAWFLGYLLVTKLVVAPAAKKFNVPLLKDL